MNGEGPARREGIGADWTVIHDYDAMNEFWHGGPPIVNDPPPRLTEEMLNRAMSNFHELYMSPLERQFALFDLRLATREEYERYARGRQNVGGVLGTFVHDRYAFTPSARLRARHHLSACCWQRDLTWQ